MQLPMAPIPNPYAEETLSAEEIANLKDEVRALAAERHAVILAHNYQLEEVQRSPTTWATRSGSASRRRRPTRT
jgi:quinolinate synthase